MRAFWIVLAAIGLASSTPAAAQAPPGQKPSPDAAAILATARDALGGDQKLANVKTFDARGRTRQVRGNNLVPIEFEIWCELPDKYVRRDEVPAQESGPTSTGFSGDTMILWPPAPEPAAGPSPKGTASGAAAKPPASATSTAPSPAAASVSAKPPAAPPDPRLARVVSTKQDFVRLTLGMFAASFAGYPLTFSLAGQAEAPQGTADIIDVKGAGAFGLKLFVSHETHLPIMVSWTTPATSVVVVAEGQPPPENVAPGTIIVKAPPLPAGTAPKEEREKYAALIQDLRKKTLAGAKPIEHRLYYADYRDIGNGIRFPFRLRRATAGETIEETNFDEFRTNVRIDPRRFTSAK
jgi:hypothetical protein